jgi:hypothetical protein
MHPGKTEQDKKSCSEDLITKPLPRGKLGSYPYFFLALHNFPLAYLFFYISYSLQDLIGISPTLCTHHIPIDPDCTPLREPQRRLNNAIREVVKKEVLKLLHAEIIYPVPHSEWVSPVQVVPKKGGMMVVRNKKNELIPQ